MCFAISRLGGFAENFRLTQCEREQIESANGGFCAEKVHSGRCWGRLEKRYFGVFAQVSVQEE